MRLASFAPPPFRNTYWTYRKARRRGWRPASAPEREELDLILTARNRQPHSGALVVDQW